MANGAKFSQIGTDIKRASDHEIHFTSEWPSIKIITNGLVTRTLNGTTDNGGIFYHHDLGFTPAFLPYVYHSDQTFEIFRAILSVDEQNIYWHNPGGGGGGLGLVQYGLFLFAIDLKKNYQAPQSNPNQASTGGTDQPYGMKFAKDGKVVSSTNMQDFLVNTDARAPLVHAVSYGLADKPSGFGTTKNFSYTHDLPYNPMFLSYVERSDFVGRLFFTNNFAGTTTNGNTIILQDIDDGMSASIVVLKDPFDVSENTIEVFV